LSTAADLLRKRMPAARVQEYETAEPAVLAIASGGADVFLGFRQVAVYGERDRPGLIRRTIDRLLPRSMPGWCPASGLTQRNRVPHLTQHISILVHVLVFKQILISKTALVWLLSR
jgi:hypothetical protein